MGVLFILVWLLGVIVPVIITIGNIRNLFTRNKKSLVPLTWCTIIMGSINYFALYSVLWNIGGDYYEAISSGYVHYPIASNYRISFLLPIILGFISLIIITISASHRISVVISAVISAVCSANIILGNIMGFFFALQIWQREEIPLILFLYLFQINMLVLSIEHIHITIQESIANMNCDNTVFKYRWMQWLYPRISNGITIRMFYMIVLLLVAIILWLILMCFNQGVDGFIKAFTMTADWRYSTQMSSLVTESDGNYDWVTKVLIYEIITFDFP